MTTNAQIGFGASFAYETSPGSGSYTTGVEVTDIGPPGAKLSTVDVTHMASPGGVREFVGGLIDPGQVSIKINFAPSSGTDADLDAWLASRLGRSAKITFANAAVWTFKAIPTDYAATIPMDGKQEATFTAQLSGSKVVS